MRSSRKLRIVSVLAALTICGGAQATLVEVDYSFTITTTAGGIFPAPKEVVGQALFDLDAFPYSSNATDAFYPLISHSVSFGGTPLDADIPGAPGTGVWIKDGTPDFFFLRSTFDAVVTGSLQLEAIGFILASTASTSAFSGTDLFVPDLSDFTVALGTVDIFDPTADLRLQLAGNPASIQFTVRQVPEPTTLALLGIGLAGLGFSRVKRSPT